jgi:hypothetical protein
MLLVRKAPILNTSWLYSFKNSLYSNGTFSLPNFHCFSAFFRLFSCLKRFHFIYSENFRIRPKSGKIRKKVENKENSFPFFLPQIRIYSAEFSRGFVRIWVNSSLLIKYSNCLHSNLNDKECPFLW